MYFNRPSVNKERGIRSLHASLRLVTYIVLINMRKSDKIYVYTANSIKDVLPKA